MSFQDLRMSDHILASYFIHKYLPHWYGSPARTMDWRQDRITNNWQPEATALLPACWPHWAHPWASPAARHPIHRGGSVDLPATAVHQVTVNSEASSQPWPCVAGVGPAHLPAHSGTVTRLGIRSLARHCQQVLALWGGWLGVAEDISSLGRTSLLYGCSGTLEPSCKINCINLVKNCLMPKQFKR